MGRIYDAGSALAHGACAAGRRRVTKDWFNAGYIFPDGFVSRVAFRSSVSLGALCVHECSIVGLGGAHWPAPTYVITAADRPSEPLVGKSCTGCWTAVCPVPWHDTLGCAGPRCALCPGMVYLKVIENTGSKHKGFVECQRCDPGFSQEHR